MQPSTGLFTKIPIEFRFKLPFFAFGSIGVDLDSANAANFAMHKESAWPPHVCQVGVLRCIHVPLERGQRDGWEARLNRLARILSFAVICLVASAPSSAGDPVEDYWISVLRKADSVQVLIKDGVTGGCWLNPKAAKAVIEDTFLKAGIRVEPGAQMQVRLSAIGLAIIVEDRRTGCAVHSELEAQHRAAAAAPNGGLLVSAVVTSFRKGSFAVGPEHLDSQLNKTASRWASEFAALWQRAHRGYR